MSALPVAEPVPIHGLPAQRAFWADTTSREVLMCGPLGCGKTFALAIKQLRYRAEHNRRCDGILLVPTYAMAERTHKREWPAIWSSLGINVRIDEKRQAFVWPWGSVTWIISAEEPDRMKSVNAGDGMVDEPGVIARDAYDTLCTRVRNPLATVRQVALGGTPEGINWLADLFAHPVPPRRTIWARHWHASIARDYAARLQAIYGHNPALLATYARGQFVPLAAGRVYGPFDRAKHVRAVEYDRHCDLVLACDFNVNTMRWEVLQVSPHEIHVLDEIALGEGSTTQDAAREFVRRWNNGFHRGAVLVTGDATGQARRTSATRTDYQVIREELDGKFREVRLLLPASNPPVRERVESVNYHLAGRGRTVVISPTCEQLVLDLERVTYRKGSAELDKSDADRTHASDALGYAIWALARPQIATGRAAVASPASREQHRRTDAAAAEW